MSYQVPSVYTTDRRVLALDRRVDVYSSWVSRRIRITDGRRIGRAHPGDLRPGRSRRRGVPHTIVGVMPAGPIVGGASVVADGWPSTDLWGAHP